ncbi:MAG: NADH:flavin oxidoreductase [Candidatus Acidiferrales bacterium]|jgi:2,4-dienoyl-CoA reductase-like NADH-dependent reductase (Old Yellow Enzyme family)
MSILPEDRTAVLFRPFTFKHLTLANRIVMAPMTRGKSPGGVPGADVGAYYRRRAEGGVGLIVTEGTYIPHPAAGFQPAVPRFYGEEALAGWKRVVDEVHAAGGKIFPQIWHVGLSSRPGMQADPIAVGPSGMDKPGEQAREPMTQAEIDAVIRAYGEAAASAERLGFDGLEIHGAHGYLIDQFFWEETNRRTDRYGGDLLKRTRFAVEVIEEIRRNVSRDYPVCLRFSQWKLLDYSAKLARTPEELERFLEPLSAAGVDIFHCSQRRFWEREFEGSPLNLAGWTRKLSGKPAISVGSVTLNQEFTTSSRTPDTAEVTGIDELLDRMGRGEFDLIAIGRSLIVNPSWPALVQRGALDELQPFQRDVLQQLV